MRRPAVIFLLFAGLALLQVSVLNLLLPSMSFNLPFTVLVLAAAFFDWPQRIAALLGMCLPLDYASAFPFGSYLASTALTLVLFIGIARRIPVRQHRSYRFLTVGIASVLNYVALVSVTTALVVIGVGPFTFAFDTSLLSGLIIFVAWNVSLSVALFGLTTFSRTIIQPRLFRPHASH